MTLPRRENAKKGRGCLDEVLHSERRFSQPKREPRVSSRLGREILEKNRGEEVKSLLDSTCESPTPRPQSSRTRTPRRRQSHSVASHINSPHLTVFSSPPRPQSHAGSRNVAESSRDTMTTRMGDRGNRAFVYRDGPCSPRVRPEAKDYAERGKGQVGRLLYHYGTLPLNEKPEPRVKDAAKQNANTGKGSVHLLFENYGNLRNEKPTPRVKPEAKMNALKNRGSMDLVLQQL